MIAAFTLIAASVVVSTPIGVEVDCGTWPGVAATDLIATVTTTTGCQNLTGKIEIAKTASAGAIQDILVVGLEQEGWTVKAGPGHTVIVFAPKGQSVKSIRFDSSTGWVPVYRFIPAPFQKPNVKKPDGKN